VNGCGVFRCTKQLLFISPIQPSDGSHSGYNNVICQLVGEKPPVNFSRQHLQSPSKQGWPGECQIWRERLFERLTAEGPWVFGDRGERTCTDCHDSINMFTVFRMVMLNVGPGNWLQNKIALVSVRCCSYGFFVLFSVTALTCDRYMCSRKRIELCLSAPQSVVCLSTILWVTRLYFWLKFHYQLHCIPGTLFVLEFCSDIKQTDGRTDTDSGCLLWERSITNNKPWRCSRLQLITSLTGYCVVLDAVIEVGSIRLLLNIERHFLCSLPASRVLSQAVAEKIIMTESRAAIMVTASAFKIFKCLILRVSCTRGLLLLRKYVLPRRSKQHIAGSGCTFYSGADDGNLL